jgi:hypothetical protein
MKRLAIEASDETAKIVLDKENGIFEMTGRSLPEDSAEFFEPVLEWVKEYKKDPNSSTEIVFKLDYFNTASSKFIQDILAQFEGTPGVKVVWYYLEDDESMEEAGSEFSEFVHLPFEFRIIPL